jgi:hypothetical protein
MSGWLKAGLIGAVIVIVLKVLEEVPCVVCCALPLEWVALGCVGALAAYWMVPPRAMGAGAGQGALAGLIAAAIGGIVGIGVSVVGATVFAPLQIAMYQQLPPEMLQAMVEAGFDPGMLTGVGAGAVQTITSGAMCCGVGLAIGAGLGALGGLIFSAVRSE